MHPACLALAATIILGSSPALANEAKLWEPLRPSTVGITLPDHLRTVAQASADSVGDPRISQLDAQIATLTEERRQVSLAGPIVATAIGGALVLIGGVTAGIAAAACNEAEDDPYTQCNQSAADAFIIGGAVAAGIGAVVAISGAVSLSNRKSERRDIDKQILDLRRKKQSILDSLEYGFDFRHGRRGLTMRIEF